MWRWRLLRQAAGRAPLLTVLLLAAMAQRRQLQTVQRRASSRHSRRLRSSRSRTRQAQHEHAEAEVQAAISPIPHAVEFVEPFSSLNPSQLRLPQLHTPSMLPIVTSARGLQAGAFSRGAHDRCSRQQATRQGCCMYACLPAPPACYCYCAGLCGCAAAFSSSISLTSPSTSSSAKKEERIQERAQQQHEGYWWAVRAGRRKPCIAAPQAAWRSLPRGAKQAHSTLKAAAPAVCCHRTSNPKLLHWTHAYTARNRACLNTPLYPCTCAGRKASLI